MIPYGSLIVYVTPKGRRHVCRLEEGQAWHSRDGWLPAERIAELDFGSVALTSLGVPVLVQEATLEDRLLHVKRLTQVIYPKDIAYICLRLGAGPGRTILEAGCGSGALTLGLSWFCGPTGKVVSHEAREEFLRLARRNLDWAGLGANVELHHRDIAEGFAQSGADALFLDVRTPWDYLVQASAALRPGATLGFLLPTTDQVGELLLGLEQGPFSIPEVCELFIRRWKSVPGRLRPEDRMTAHTGFLVFCRLQAGAEILAGFRSLGTRERKQEAARLNRS
ncbi:MAG: tRNA (adenine-N1)-methyltransferase [Desulfovibrio sp.]|jgi:tRNA (adenine57-N1/adenine58-N1)-methyltransferase|nr:tRNA (adenine-N1)-methyltransferase [Desulfovibrio sp.]